MSTPGFTEFTDAEVIDMGPGPHLTPAELLVILAGAVAGAVGPAATDDLKVIVRRLPSGAFSGEVRVSIGDGGWTRTLHVVCHTAGAVSFIGIGESEFRAIAPDAIAIEVAASIIAAAEQYGSL